MNTYTITFADGTKLEGLTLNGDNFVSKDELTPEFFTRNRLEAVLIERDADNNENNKDNDESENQEIFSEDSDLIGVHDHMKFVQVMPFDGAYWFVLRDLTAAEWKEIELEARLSYLEMMAE